MAVRSEEEVETILHFAKLEKSELLDGVQCLGFSPSLDNDAVRLLEVEPEMLGILRKGDRMTLRGDQVDNAVLCTGEKTYEVKTSETSNTLLLVPDLKLPNSENRSTGISAVAITGVIHSYFELRECRPKLMKLKALLEEAPYKGPLEDELNTDKKKYSFEELLSLVQASENELKSRLKQLHTLEIYGRVRLVHFEYLCEVLSHVTGLMEEEGWECDAVPLQPCLDTLSELYPRFLIEHVLNWIGEPNMDTRSEKNTYKIQEDVVCQLFGEMVLRPLHQCNLSEFESAWQACVPDSFRTSLHQLRGIGLVEHDSKPPCINYFPASELSEDVLDRFDSLFRKKRQWTLEEISPYISDLVTSKVGVSALLTKHARAATQSGVKLFSSRRPLN